MEVNLSLRAELERLDNKPHFLGGRASFQPGPQTEEGS
jgi:hypothetical protein